MNQSFVSKGVVRDSLVSSFHSALRVRRANRAEKRMERALLVRAARESLEREQLRCVTLINMQPRNLL